MAAFLGWIVPALETLFLVGFVPAIALIVRTATRLSRSEQRHDDHDKRFDGLDKDIGGLRADLREESQNKSKLAEIMARIDERTELIVAALRKGGLM